MFLATQTGFRLDFKNGWAVSVQWGTGNYGSNRFNKPATVGFLEARTAEIAIYKPDGEMVHDSLGWQSADEVAAIIHKVARGTYPEGRPKG